MKKNIKYLKNSNFLIKKIYNLLEKEKELFINYKNRDIKNFFEIFIKKKIFLIITKKEEIKINNKIFFKVIKYFKFFLKTNFKNIYKILKNLNFLKIINLKLKEIKNNKILIIEQIIICSKIKIVEKNLKNINKEDKYKIFKTIFKKENKHLKIIFENNVRKNFSKNIILLEKKFKYNKKKIINFIYKIYKTSIIFNYGKILKIEKKIKIARKKNNKIKICFLKENLIRNLIIKFNFKKIFLKN